MKKLLWEELQLKDDFIYTEVDNAYQKLKNKTPRKTFAWKVLRDKYYSEVYREYKDEELLVRAGFLQDTLTFKERDFYNLNLLTTPFDKLKDNVKELKKPVVLLSTGGFYPIHDGHIQMMEKAKKVIEEKGYNVIGGYLSLSHESYIKTKPYYIKNQYERMEEGREYLKNSDWLMIDPWESIYVRTAINFTDVIERLEKYLHKYIDDRIKVIYVFGGDNVDFMYCFRKNGFAVCINRYGSNNKFIKHRNHQKENMIFIENLTPESTLSSRNIRKKLLNETKTEQAGNYLIRNEGLLPIKHLIKDNNEELLKELHKDFLNQFKTLLSNCFDNKISVKTINMEKQVKDAKKYLKDKKTISLDCYFKGTYNLEVSRLFSISSYQDKYTKLIGRLGYQYIEEQVKKIKKGNYTLVDDDSVTGRTLNSVKENLPQGVETTDTFLLANSIHENVFDVVDLRDFIIGGNQSGLVVALPNKEIIRVPYIMPYVNLTTRASIPPNKTKDFSIMIWKMNKEFYQKYNRNIRLKEMNQNFIILMKYVGFKEEDKIIDICQWHINKLLDDHLQVISYQEEYREDIIQFLKSIAIKEFGFKEWKDYLENKSFNPYQQDKSKFLIVLNREGKIVATVGGLKVDKMTIKLNSFYIKKEYRNQKIGTKLFNKILKYSKEKNYHHMILCTYDKYEIATKFYQKRGFQYYKEDGLERWYKKELK